MAPSVDQFRQSLVEAGILSAERLREFEDSISVECDTAQALVEHLVDRETITRFQANAVYQGKAQSLVMGNYLILDELGQGGMGTVYKARHRRMNRIVALKVLPEKLVASPDAVKRFQREVEAAARVEHPNIVTAYDADEANGVHFLVMQFADGADLSRVVKQHGQLPLPKAVNYVLQAAKALEYAHANGIIHRDIKPANLMLCSDGTVKMLDMGLARFDRPEGVDQATPAATELTGTGAIMGTVDYMAPEQALDTKQADARSDIYSLGCTLYFLLTAKSIYGGDTLMKRLVAHREAAIPSLSSHCGDVPPPLEAVYRKMVAKNPVDRPQTAAEVVRMLASVSVESVVVGEPGNFASTVFSDAEMVESDPVDVTTEFRPPAPERSEDTALSQIDETARLAPATQPVSRTESIDRAAPRSHLASRRTLLVAGGASGLALLTVILVWGTSSFLGRSTVDRRAPTESRPQPLDASDDPSVETSELVPSDVDQPAAKPVFTNNGPVGLRFDGQATHVVVDSLPLDHTQPFTVEAIVTPTVNQRGVLLSMGNICSFELVQDSVVARLPDGLVWGGVMRGQSTYKIVDSTVPPQLGEAVHLACVSDGVDYVMYVNGSSAGGFVKRKIPAGDVPQTDPLVIGGRLTDGRLEMPFAGIVHEIRISTGERPAVRRTQLEVDADTIAMFDFATTDGKTLQDLSTHGHHGTVVDAQWSAGIAPPSDALAAAGALDLPPDTPAEVVAVLGDWRFRDWRLIQGLAFNGDGTLLAAGGDNGNVLVWELPAGRLAHQIPTGDVYALALSSDGRVLATDGFNLTLWRVADGQQLHTIDHAGISKHVTLSSDGSLVATIGEDEETGRPVILVHDVASGEERHQLSAHTDAITGLLFHPGGRFLASASDDGTVKFWDTANGQETGRVMEGISEKARTLSFSQDGSLLAFATNDASKYDGEVRIWDVDAEALRAVRFKTPFIGNPSVQISPNGQLLVTAKNSRIDLWDVAKGEQVWSVYGIPGGTDQIRFSPDGKLIAAAGNAGRIQLWEVATGNLWHQPQGHLSRPIDATFSPDGKTVASIDGDSMLCLWDVANQELVHSATLDGYHPYSLAFAPDGGQITVGVSSGIEVFDLTEMQSTLHRYLENRMGCYALSANGEFAAFGGYKKPVELVDTRSGTQVFEFDAGLESETKAIAFSPNDQLLAIPGPSRTIGLWNVTKRTLAATLEGVPGDEVLSLAFNSTATTLVAACQESSSYSNSLLAAWDVSTGELNAKFGSGPGLIEAVAFRHDDNVLANTSSDCTVRLWDARTWQHMRTIPLGRGSCMIPSVEFSPDGRYLVTANSNGTVTIIDVAGGEHEQANP